ncbi:MAG: Ig-like domain-containing protein [Caldilineaceae bacterium]
MTLTYGNDDDGRPFTTTVTLFDDNGGSASGTFRVAVANTNPTVDLTGPGAVNENPTLARTYNFTVTDTGIGSEVYSIVGSPSCGAGTLTGTPTIDSNTGIGNFQCIFPDGPSNTSVNVEVSDGTVSDTTALPVTVSNLNPVAVNDTDTTDEDTPVVVDVLGNDSDVPADTVTIGSASTPAVGQVTVAANNLQPYLRSQRRAGSPAAGDSQDVTFTYSAVDEDGGSATGTVTVTVSGVNDAPVLGGAVITTDLNDTAGAQAIFGGVTVADVDTADTMTLTIQLSTSAGTISGGGFALVSSGLYRATGLSAAAANTALDNAVFTPANNTGPNGTFSTTFTVTATDSQAAVDNFTSAALTIPRINGADAERRSGHHRRERQHRRDRHLQQRDRGRCRQRRDRQLAASDLQRRGRHDQRRRLHRSGRRPLPGDGLERRQRQHRPGQRHLHARQQHGHIRLIQHHLHGDGDRQPDRVRFVSPAPRDRHHRQRRAGDQRSGRRHPELRRGRRRHRHRSGDGRNRGRRRRRRLRHRHAHRLIHRGSNSAEDVLSIRNQGSGAGLIGALREGVSYDGANIGTYTGGSGGNAGSDVEQQRHAHRAGVGAQHHLPKHQQHQPHRRRPHRPLCADRRRRRRHQRQRRRHGDGEPDQQYTVVNRAELGDLPREHRQCRAAGDRQQRLVQRRRRLRLQRRQCAGLLLLRRRSAGSTGRA